MRYFYLIILILFPTFAFASCSEDGSTVIYINGINATLVQAQKDAENLRDKFIETTKDNSADFFNAYNQTHGEVTDVYKTITQMLRWDSATWNEDTNGDEILNQIHTDLTTQKLLLVGHSQGAFYANETYKYLTTHGVSTSAVRVFNVATPASYTAGSGSYITSTNDSVINQARTLRNQPGLSKLAEPLPANVTLNVTSDDPRGHGFSSTYLAQSAADIVAEMRGGITTLSPTSNTDLPSCFTPPNDTAVHKAAVSLGNFGATTGTFAYLWGAGALNGSIAAVGSALDAAHQVVADVGTAVGGINGLAHSAEPEYESTNFNVVNHMFGTQNQQVDGENLYDLLHDNNPSQGGAVILATADDTEELVPEVAQAPTESDAPTVPIGPAPGFSPGGGGSAAPTQPVVEDASPQSTVADQGEEDHEATSTPSVVDTSTDAASSTDDGSNASTTPQVPTPSLPSSDELATMTGFYCSGDTSVLQSGASYTYRAPSSSCHYLVGYVGRDWTAEAVLLSGTVGSSTIVERVNNGGHNYTNLDSYGGSLIDAVSGKTFTIVFYQYYNNVGGMFNAYYVGDMMRYLETGLRNDGVTDTAPYEYQTVTIVIP